MRLDYLSCRSNFRLNAPVSEGYKGVHKLVFESLILELELVNQTRSGNEARTVSVSFEVLVPELRIGRAAFFAALDWLDQAGYIQLIKGINRHQSGYIRMLNLAEISEETYTISSSSIAVSVGTTTELLENRYRTATGLLDTNPPPHPPIEEKNNINTTATTAAAEAEGVVFPENISLEDWQISSLMKKEPVAVLNEALFMLSGIKAAKGTRMPDYYCLTDFVITSAKKRMSQPARADPAPLPVSVSGILPRPRSKQPD